MKTTLNKILMTASFMAVIAAAAPAMADPSVLCSVRNNLKGSAAVSPNYQAGVDVNGKAVVPADVSSPAMTIPEVTRIPLTIDLAQRLNEVMPAGMKLETTVGLVEVGPGGSVRINGKDLTGPADSMCATIDKQKAAAMKTKDTPKKRTVKKPVAPVADVPAVEAAPAPEVAAPEAVVAPVVETPVAPAPETPVTPPVAEPAPTPAPQILEPAPAVEPAPATEVAPAPAPTPDVTPAPSPEAQGEILSPAEEGGMPRPPVVDPLAPPPPGSDGTLSGGAQ